MYALSRTAGTAGAHRKPSPPTAATTAPRVKTRKRSAVVRSAARQHLEALFAPGPLRPFHPLGRGRAGFRPGRGHAEDPGVGVHGIHRFRRRVRVRFGPGLRLLVTALPQPLGVTALHSRPAGKQPNGGGEAFRRTGFVQLVLPPEPHGHQVGGPGPDNDCVDEAAAAHPHTVEGRGRADPPIEPVCRTIRLISRTFL